MRLQKTPFLTIIHDGIELVTRPVIEENIADGDVFDECVGALYQAMGPDQVDGERSVVPQGIGQSGWWRKSGVGSSITHFFHTSILTHSRR